MKLPFHSLLLAASVSSLLPAINALPGAIPGAISQLGARLGLRNAEQSRPAQPSARANGAPLQDPTRTLNIVSDIYTNPDGMVNGESSYYAPTARLVFGAMGADPAMTVEVGPIAQSPSFALIIRAGNIAVSNMLSPPPLDADNYDFPGFWMNRTYNQQLGLTTITNAQLFSLDTGTGLATDIWGPDPKLLWGEGAAEGYLGPMTFIDNILEELMGSSWPEVYPNIAKNMAQTALTLARNTQRFFATTRLVFYVADTGMAELELTSPYVASPVAFENLMVPPPPPPQLAPPRAAVVPVFPTLPPGQLLPVPSGLSKLTIPSPVVEA